jgi:Polysaccharide lyase
MKALRYLLSTAAVVAIVLAIAHENRAQPRGGAAPLQALNFAKSCSPVAPGSHERYRLPPPNTFAADVSFASDWSKSATAGWFGAQIMDRCRMQPDGLMTWHGKAAVRVEVQPDDDPLALKANSERAEMLIMQHGNGGQIKETAAVGRQYYATSYYFPPAWQGQQLPWSAFAPTDCSLNDQNRCNSWSFVWQFYGWGGLSAAQATLRGSQRYRFNGAEFAARGGLTLGKWTDFVFLVDWRTGAYKVWRRDEGEKTFTLVLSGATAVIPGREIYAKQGLYRGGNVSGRTDVLWIGPTARGASFAAVEWQAFGTEDGDSE